MRELRECKDLYGPLSHSNRQLILTLLRCADKESWYFARRIVLTASPIITLEMAVKVVAPRWVSEVPDSFTVRRAILHALHAQEQFREREASWNLD